AAGAAEGEEAGKQLEIGGGAAINVDLGQTSRAGAGEEFLEAVAEEIPRGHVHAAAERLRLGKEAEDRLQGDGVEQGHLRSAARPGARDDGAVAVRARVEHRDVDAAGEGRCKSVEALLQGVRLAVNDGD